MTLRQLLILLLLSCAFMLSGVTIYELQYTTNAGSGGYPSPYAGQNVTTSGVVTATGFNNGNSYFISMPEGGAWKGILVYDNTHNPQVGDLINISAQCWEYYNMTELRSVTAYSVVSSGHTVPAATVTTAEANAEAYEGVLVEVHGASVSQTMNQYGEWYCNDGSGAVMVAGGFFDQESLSGQITQGAVFDIIRGVVNYSYGDYGINPRNEDDVQTDTSVLTVTVPSFNVQMGQSIYMPVNVSTLTQAMNIQSYHFVLHYNVGVIAYQGYSVNGSLSDNGSMVVTPSTGAVDVHFVCNGWLEGQGLLMSMNFTAVGNGNTPLAFSPFTFNDTLVPVVHSGEVNVSSPSPEVIDTLSVIQRPLMNIPAIVVPGESMQIECSAPSTTTGWAASLKLQGHAGSIPMTVTNAVYQQLPPRWVLTAVVPQVNVFELYDLQVTANGINDRTKHSVSVVPSRKSNYYFAHVTDLHMPTHIFYPDAGYDTDSTEVEDFREVVKDLNLIRPEFVLITGDLVNQGELEDFENLHFYAKVKRVLGELNIPVYVVTGNHDIGGWTGTPPPAGTAMKNWWRFFGWSWLNNSSTAWQYHTQDYSFDYGDIHFTGLEAYDNYDNYLPSIFGNNSFTAAQMQWLQADIAASIASTKVLFYHYDFDNELNLSTLGVNMGLWGHIHSDNGNLTTTPYDLATKAVCDGYRAYRIVRVTNGTQLTPYATVSSGYSGTNLSVSYFPSNTGIADSVNAVAVNNQPITYENALLRFIMPAGPYTYTVYDGTLEQVDYQSTGNVCYVRCVMTANSSVMVTVAQSGVANDDNVLAPAALSFVGLYPNPFTKNSVIMLKNPSLQQVTVSVYNTKGVKVCTLINAQQQKGTITLNWDGRTDRHTQAPSGMYIVRAQSDEGSISRKLVYLK